MPDLVEVTKTSLLEFHQLDGDDAKALTHRITGAASMLGATTIAKAAHALEFNTANADVHLQEIWSGLSHLKAFLADPT